MQSAPNQSSQPNESDLELLSAYLDDQLSSIERGTLERRLEQESGLRLALNELQTTVTILRDLEPLRPPRSFTLDPASVRQAPLRRPLSWFGQLGTSLAGMMLVLVASVQLLTAGAPTAGMLAAGEPEAAMPFESFAAPTQTIAPSSAAEVAPAPMALPEAADAAATDAPISGAAMLPQEPAPLATSSAFTGGGATAPETAPADSFVSPPAPAGANTSNADAETNARQAQADAANPNPPVSGATAVGLPPGLTLGLGLGLIAIGSGWYLYSRRRETL